MRTRLSIVALAVSLFATLAIRAGQSLPLSRVQPAPNVSAGSGFVMAGGPCGNYANRSIPASTHHNQAYVRDNVTGGCSTTADAQAEVNLVDGAYTVNGATSCVVQASSTTAQDVADTGIVASTALQNYTVGEPSHPEATVELHAHFQITAVLSGAGYAALEGDFDVRVGPFRLVGLFRGFHNGGDWIVTEYTPSNPNGVQTTYPGPNLNLPKTYLLTQQGGVGPISFLASSRARAADDAQKTMSLIWQVNSEADFFVYEQ